MEWRIITSKYSKYLLFIFFFILYALGANTNSSLDAWSYAADVSNGENLFPPHHLIYNLLGYIWVTVINFFIDADALGLLKLLNAAFSTAILFILFKLLKLINGNSKVIFPLVALVGSCWGIMRYATENETYIVPLFFSLLGSFFLMKGESKKDIIFSGLFAALATLFHQVMFFWWFGLMLGVILKRRLKNIFLFAFPALIVPIAYALVVYFKFGVFSIDLLFRFVFSDYYSGAASLELGLKTGLLLLIGVFRSFIQVHGYIGNLLNQSNWYWNAGIVSVVTIMVGVIIVIKHFRQLKLKKNSTLLMYIIITLLHLFFALVGGGNSEFLVILPVLVSIILINVENLSKVALSLIVMGILIWNISFGLLPLKYKTLDDSRMVVDHIEKNTAKSAYILHNLPRIENELNYKGNKYNAILVKYNQQAISFADSINTLLKNGYSVYTNAYNRPKTLSREDMVSDTDSTRNPFEQFRAVAVDSANSITGRYYLYLLVPSSKL